jgi:hypothetical protein
VSDSIHAAAFYAAWSFSQRNSQAQRI